MDTRLIVPLGGGIGLVYVTYMLLESMLDEGFTVWGVAAMVVMGLAALASLAVAWKRNKTIKAEMAAFEAQLEKEKQERQ